MSFEIRQDEVNRQPCLFFNGQIDEEATFPTLNSLGSEAIVDLKGVSSINSVGIRAWILWFGQYTNTKFTFLNCPKALVMQMNMVEGFLPEGAEVQSLEVPFFCESCDEEINVMFTVGKEILLEGENVRLEYDKGGICPDGGDPELDVSEVKYFRFLTQDKAEAA